MSAESLETPSEQAPIESGPAMDFSPSSVSDSSPNESTPESTEVRDTQDTSSFIQSTILKPSCTEGSCQPDYSAKRSEIIQAGWTKRIASADVNTVESVKEMGTLAPAHLEGVVHNGKNIGDFTRTDGVWRDSSGRTVSESGSAAFNNYVEKDIIAPKEHEAKERFNQSEVNLHYLKENAPEEAGGWLQSDNKVEHNQEVDRAPEPLIIPITVEQPTIVPEQKKESDEKPLSETPKSSSLPISEIIPVPPKHETWDASKYFFVSSDQKITSFDTDHEEIKQTFEKIADHELEGSRPLSPKLCQFGKTAEQWHEERLQQLGMDEATPWSDRMGQKSFLIENDLENLDNPSGAEGHSAFGVIILKDYSNERYEAASAQQLESSDEFLPMAVPAELLEGLSPEDAAAHLRNFLQGQTLLHEKYHQSKPHEIILKSTGPSQGVNIREAHFADWPKALEEGLAMRMEQQAEELLAREFPEGAALYQRLLQHVMETHPRLQTADQEIQDVFRIKDFDGKAVIYSTKRYYHSTHLVDFLSQTLGEESFERAMERFRIERDKEQLVTLIKQSFGEEAVELIFQATEANASAVARQLVQLRGRRS